MNTKYKRRERSNKSEVLLHKFPNSYQIVHVNGHSVPEYRMNGIKGTDTFFDGEMKNEHYLSLDGSSPKGPLKIMCPICNFRKLKLVQWGYFAKISCSTSDCDYEKFVSKNSRAYECYIKLIDCAKNDNVNVNEILQELEQINSVKRDKQKVKKITKKDNN